MLISDPIQSLEDPPEPTEDGWARLEAQAHRQATNPPTFTSLASKTPVDRLRFSLAVQDWLYLICAGLI